MITKPTKYTEIFVNKELKRLLKIIQKDKELIIMGELFEKTDYSIQRFSEWEHKFEANEEITESIKKIKSLFENRINKGALTNSLNATMAIFNLKNNYGWKDKHETDLTVQLPSPIYGSQSTDV